MIPEGAIISGFISKIINDVIDVTKDKIMKADQNRKSEYQNFETRIYQVIIDAINEFTYGEYVNQDILYDTAEKMLNGFKNGEKDNIVAVKSGLNNFVSNVDKSECERFIIVLCHEISKENNFDVYKEILLLLLRQETKYNHDELQYIRKKLDEVIFKLDNKTVIKEVSVTEDIKFQNNKKEEYIKNWNSRLFLHKNNNEKPITLADAFIIPDCVKHKSIKGIDFSDSDKLNIVIEKFIRYKKTVTMLLTGVPGIGKSTITSWIANEYKGEDSIIILRFRDWKRKELEEGLLNAICEKLCCETEDLEKRILILDGFDEMKALDIRERLLNDFVNDIKDLENFKCVMTSRPAYVNADNFQVVIQISRFDEKEIDAFYKIIKNSSLSNMKKIKLNLEVLGIPVILYMAIMSDVNFGKNPTKPELYNRIFAEEGGIFDKFNDGETEYSTGKQIMRNAKNIKDYLQFLRRVAFMMFEKNDLSLEIRNCEIPKLKFNRENLTILEFPIKHLFESNEKNIEFIHKSIYDYFVSEYIFLSIDTEIKNIKNNNCIKNISKVFGELLKCNNLSLEIIEFLKYKVEHENLNEKHNIVYQAFQLMLQDGMIYYTKGHYKNVIECERKVFANMLEILHILDCNNLIYTASIDRYLKFESCTLNLQGMDLSEMGFEGVELKNLNMSKTRIEGANLENINLRGKNLEGIIWKRVNLINANLENANLNNADLENSDLSEAKLSYTTLIKAKLVKVDLIGADLQGAIFWETDLREASLYGANLIGTKLDKVNINKANINYSIWAEWEINEILSKLKDAVFTNIVLTTKHGLRKIVCREELFSKQNLSVK